jgi:nucleoside-diphosphate-sugar epimerase
MVIEREAVQQRVLVTGATGIVGSEIHARLRGRPDMDVVGTSRRGDGARGILSWHIGAEAPPHALRGPWDVVVNTAADTRWSMTPEQATAANVRSVEALLDEVRPTRRLIHLSTAHAIGYRDSIESAETADYRNAYEWSKAAAERMLRQDCDNALIIRFPMVLGRRTDGVISRFTGYYKLLRALASGLLPAMVGRPTAYVDLVAADDIAERVERAVLDDGIPEQRGDPVILGRGAEAPGADGALDLIFETLNGWRAARGVPPLERPPLLEPERWDRFFLPFARQEMSPVQLSVIDVFAEFRPYLSIMEPFRVTDVVGDINEVIRLSVRYWAEQNLAVATAVPRPWR